MIQEGVVLGYVVFERDIEIDKAKIDAIGRLPPPTCVKGMQSFLEHTGFHWRFIKDFSKIAKPLSLLLAKDTPLSFLRSVLRLFYRFNEALITAPIIQLLDWSLPFEIMCDDSDYAVGAVLGQQRDKKP